MLKISLAITLIGVMLLFVISENVEIPTRTDIKSEDVGGIIQIRGRVTKVKDSEKVAYIDIIYPQTTQVLLFKDSNISISENMEVLIVGEVKENLDLIAHKIEIYQNK